jgi:anti-sigma-K factor RskA
MSNNQHIAEEDLTLYALGSLPAAEAALIRAHVDDCPECKAALSETAGALAVFAMTLPQESPSAQARERLMQAIAPTAAAPEIRRGWFWIPAFSLACIVLLAAVGVLAVSNSTLRHESLLLQSQLNSQQQQMQSLRNQTAEAAQAQQVLATLRASDTVRFTLVAANAHPTPQIKTFYRRSTGAVVLTASNLPSLPPGKAYELWFIGTGGGSPIPAGTFRPDNQGNVSLQVSQLSPGAESKMFAVTIEDAAGSATPTPPIVYSGAAGD